MCLLGEGGMYKSRLQPPLYDCTMGKGRGTQRGLLRVWCMQIGVARDERDDHLG